MSSIGVVIPLYNHAHFIRATMASVYEQELQPQRFIIIDDGSTDDSLAIAKKYARPDTEIITQSNSGAHTTINRGVQLAIDCEWISILNSDDLWHPTRLLRCMGVAYKAGNKDVFCTGLHLIDTAGEALESSSPKARRMEKIWELVKSKKDPLLSLAISNFAKTTSNVFARRSFMLEHPFGKYRYVHDYYFFLQAAAADQLGIIAEDLMGYRIHTSNTIKANGQGPVMLETLQIYLDLMKSLAIPMKKSPQLRSRMREFLQILLGNYTDFRGELLVQMLANLLTSHGYLFQPANVENLETFQKKSEPLPPSLPLP